MPALPAWTAPEGAAARHVKSKHGMVAGIWRRSLRLQVHPLPWRPSCITCIIASHDCVRTKACPCHSMLREQLVEHPAILAPGRGGRAWARSMMGHAVWCVAFPQHAGVEGMRKSAVGDGQHTCAQRRTGFVAMSVALMSALCPPLRHQSTRGSTAKMWNLAHPPRACDRLHITRPKCTKTHRTLHRQG